MPSTPQLPDRGRAAPRRYPVPGWVDPAEAFAELYAGTPYAVWLDAGAAATTGTSYLAGADEHSWLITASATDGTVTRSRPLAPTDAPVTTRHSVFDILRADADADADALPEWDRAADGPDDVAFRLGWIGWLGYALSQPAGDRAHGPAAGTSAAAGSGPPDAALLLIDRAVVFDHAARSVTLLGRPAPGESHASLDTWARVTGSRLAAIGQRTGTSTSTSTTTAASAAPSSAVPTAEPEVRWRHDAAQYAALIRQCQASIAAGDAYQLCLTNEVTVAGHFDALALYGHLRASSPSHHGGMLRFGEYALLSASPEEFLTVSPDGRMRTRPIKGTRPRSSDPRRDAMLRAELLASDKERAENLMIVDLMRNDLGRVAALGSVAVTGLLQVETYPHVHQLVSTVEARLAPGLTAVDALEAAFPAGSMTGAPKASAMAILATLEGGDRGVYAGAFGYLGDDGALDLAMVIRSIVLGPAGASIGTGGGITALSVAEEEIEETRVKARALVAAILASSQAADLAGSQGLVT